MSENSRIGTGALLFSIVIALLITPAASAVSACENLTAQAQSWLKSINWHPIHPEDLKLVPAQSRRAVLSQLPPEVRSTLWRESFESYIANNTGLTGEQVRVLNMAIDLAGPEVFAIRPGDPQWTEKVDDPTRELVRQAREVFSPSAFQAIFVDMDKVLADPDPGSTPINACDCNISLGACSIPGHTGTCKAGSCLTSQRCGALGNQNCDGQCDFSVAPNPGGGISAQ
jgi:hypothetical protein